MHHDTWLWQGKTKKNGLPSSNNVQLVTQRAFREHDKPLSNIRYTDAFQCLVENVYC